jgi:cysteine synthase
MTLRLHRENGLMVGPSTGAIVHAVEQYGPATDDIIVGVSPDSALKYTSYFAEMLGGEGEPSV